MRCYNPPRLDEPLGWLSRDHRKCLMVDEQVAFVTGLCVGRHWEGNEASGLCAVARHRRRGARPGGRGRGAGVRRQLGGLRAAAARGRASAEPPPAAGDVSLRVVAGTPGTSGLFRLDQLVAALARRTLWLTDAYYAGTSGYVQALRAAAQDGVDVRLLVPGRGSDIRIVQAVSRAGYRALLEAGVRVFEWNGPMIHAKTAVADGRWARVGSTNLNVASWIGNRELDVVVEDEGFARQMEEQYEKDIGGSTEIVLSQRRRVRYAGDVRMPRRRGAGGSASRAAAGALRFGNAIGAVLSPRKLHGAAERRVLLPAALALMALAPIAILWPQALAWPLGIFALWMGLALLVRALRITRSRPPA